MFFQYALVPKIFFPVWLQNQLKSAELEPVLIHTKKFYIATYYRQFSTSIKIKTIKLKSVFFARSFDHSELTKLVLNF